MSEGLKDYTMDIARIARGELYPQFTARSYEKLKIFLYAAFAGSELAVGETKYLFDFETFLDTPYTSPAGWLADFREWMFTFNGLCRLDVVCGDFPFLTLETYPQIWALTHTYEQIIFFDSRFWDPTAISPHTWTFSITNEDTIAVRGAVQVAMVLTDISSYHPETKMVKCRSCKYMNTVPLQETRIKCEKCGAVFFVPFFPGRTI